MAALAGGGGERVEEEGHGAAEDTLDLGDLVTGVDKVVEGRDDGEAGTDGGLVVDLGARLLRSAEDLLPKLVGAREGLLVGSDDADAIAKEEWVGVGDVLGAGVVDEDGLVAGGLEVLDQLGRGEGSLGGGGELGGDIVDGDSGIVRVVDSLLAGADVGEDELGAGSALGERLELAEEALSYPASA